jgi:hypothetical protein
MIEKANSCGRNRRNRVSLESDVSPQDFLKGATQRSLTVVAREKQAVTASDKCHPDSADRLKVRRGTMGTEGVHQLHRTTAGYFITTEKPHAAPRKPNA